MVSNTEGFVYNSTISPMVSTPVKKPSARKSLFLFIAILDVKKKTSTSQFRAAKSKHKATKY